MNVELTAAEREILDTFERGRRIQETLNSSGWRDILEMLESRVKSAEKDLLNKRLIDDAEIIALHRRATTMRELFDNVLNDAKGAVEAARQVPQLIVPTRSSDPGTTW